MPPRLVRYVRRIPIKMTEDPCSAEEKESDLTPFLPRGTDLPSKKRTAGGRRPRRSARGAGQLGDEEEGVDGADAGREAIAVPGGVAVNRHGLAALDNRHGVVAGGYQQDALGVLSRQL